MIKTNYKLRTFIILLFGALLLIQFAGCAKTSKKPIPKTKTTQNAAPVGVDRVKELARDIIRVAGIGNWGTVDNNRNMLKNDWSVLKKEIKGKVPEKEVKKTDSQISILNTAIDKKEKLKTQDTANAITGTMADIQSYYDGKVPPELSKIGFYLRETVLGDEQNNMKRSEKNYKLAEEMWKKVKKQVNTNTTGEINFQDKLDSLKLAIKAKQKKNIVKFGNQSITALDKVKVDFKK